MGNYIKKKDYIALYGEEAYKKLAIERKLKDRTRYEKNKETIKARTKEYKLSHKDYYVDYMKQYYLDNKYKFKEYNNNRKANNPEYEKIRYENNKDYCREKSKIYRKTKEGKAICLIGNYRYSDKLYNRGQCTLTKEWILQNIFNSKCIYCGDSNWEHLGADRIDNSIPHTPDNCICSCGVCNAERQLRKMTVEEFIEYRKTHPRDTEPIKPQEIVEINGIKVIRKKAV